MREPYTEFLNRMRERLLGLHGKLPLSVRRDIIEGRIVDGTLNAFVVRVRANAASVTQEHIDALKASGLSEDEIFDATLCAAFYAGVERFEAATKALSEAGDAT